MNETEFEESKNKKTTIPKKLQHFNRNAHFLGTSRKVPKTLCQLLLIGCRKMSDFELVI